MKATLLYRNAGNWKVYFDCELTRDFKIGDEILMGEYGTPTKEEFFPEISQWEFDNEDDHDILEVYEIHQQ